MNKFLISGMFRSGTTLLARMLNTHRDIVCVSDPFRPFFNCFRDVIAKQIGVETDPYDPLGDYFADDEQYKLFNKIQQTSLNIKFPQQERERLLKKIFAHTKHISPKILDHLKEIKGKYFWEVYDYLFSIVSKSYGKGDEKWQGTKEVWVTEFLSVLAEYYKDYKFIVMIRDPRAVAASKNSRKEKYPWLFLIRQWRKLSILAWHYNNYSSFNERVMLVKYEDLVREPNFVADEIYNFLEINKDDSILNPANFVDGKGERWLQNSSYQNKKIGFNTKSISKWKDVLQPGEIEYIEQLCFPEMKLFDYNQVQERDWVLRDEILINPPYINKDKLASWIEEYYQNSTYTSLLNELGKEIIRRKLILNPNDLLIDEKVIKKYYLSISFFAKVKKKFFSGGWSS